MIGWFEALVLGLLQGVTEYLPVSSSGHLVLAQHLFGVTEPTLFFDIVVHLGTLAAVMVYYRRDLVQMATEIGSGVRALLAGSSWRDTMSTRPELRLALLILVGSVPTAIIGLLFEDLFERLFGSVQAVGAALLVTGAALLATRWAPEPRRGAATMRWTDALLIGVAQGLAITPGLSRSGATICVALYLGVERELAARYSFLLSIPAIVGALLLKLGEAGNGVATSSLVVGFATAAVTGLLSLALLVHLVKRGRLAWFSAYCFAVGLAALLLASR